MESYEKSGSRGVQFGINYFLKHTNIIEKIGLQEGLENKTFIIQVIIFAKRGKCFICSNFPKGLGRVGEQIGTYLEASGARCVGVKEIDAYVYDSNGFSFSVRR